MPTSCHRARDNETLPFLPREERACMKQGVGFLPAQHLKLLICNMKHSERLDEDLKLYVTGRGQKSAVWLDGPRKPVCLRGEVQSCCRRQCNRSLSVRHKPYHCLHCPPGTYTLLAFFSGCFPLSTPAPLDLLKSCALESLLPCSRRNALM